MQTFFLRIADGADRPSAFASAVRAVKAVRFNDFGTYTVRLPEAGPWIVVDWHAALLELPGEALENISQTLGTELIALSAIAGHGRSMGQLFIKRLRSGKAIPGHTVETKADRVTPVSGDPDRLPTAMPVENLPEFAAKLSLPENTLPASVPTVEIRCVPARLAAWVIAFFLGGILALLLT